MTERTPVSLPTRALLCSALFLALVLLDTLAGAFPAFGPVFLAIAGVLFAGVLFTVVRCAD